jgi:hypothetical protein
MTICCLTEEQHVERMAKAIYLSHVRRVTMVTAWDYLAEDRREAFRALARNTVAGADRIRTAARRARSSLLAAHLCTRAASDPAIAGAAQSV